MNTRKISFVALFLIALSALGLGIYNFVTKEKPAVRIEQVNGLPGSSAVFTKSEAGEVIPLDFTRVAEKVMPAVVFIKSTQTIPAGQMQPYSYPELPEQFRDFFGPFFEQRPQPRQNQRPPSRIGQGSGVIITPDGYVVTNNHVVAEAEEVEVRLNDNRTYDATVVGLDPTTDLALLKIKEENLPFLPFVDSDKVKVGEWVLAVGNPFNLTSTVTAGIVSAKGRNINILRERYAVESFIQTDAAINPGNSGGALVNLNGALVGINTAIASPTGVYSGYGFAVPSNIVSKVVEDLTEYGVVQRGVLGVMIRTVDGDLAREEGLDVTQGAYVDSLLSNSAAGAAGVEPGDVIVEVDGMEINSSPALQEAIARRRPGDEVMVVVERDGKRKSFSVTLTNIEGNEEIVTVPKRETLQVLGADLEAIDEKTARKLDIDGGVRVTKLLPGKLRKYTQIREGFIITKIDGKKVRSVEDVSKILEDKTGGVMMEGVYENVPGTQYYAFGM